MITEQQLIDAKYTRYPTEYKDFSDYFYQKKFIDLKGIRYFVEFLHYPILLRAKFRGQFANMNESFSMELHIEEPPSTFQLHSPISIQDAEEHAYRVWCVLGSIYYEEYTF